MRPLIVLAAVWAAVIAWHNIKLCWRNLHRAQDQALRDAIGGS